MNYLSSNSAGSAPEQIVAPVTRTDGFVSVVKLPDGYALLPITLSITQVCSWTGLGKSKTQELINSAALTTAKVDGRTLVLTSSVIALIERNRVTGQG